MSVTVVMYNEDKFQETGIVALVYPFGYMREWSFVVYPGCVAVDGSANLTVGMARDFAVALHKAANIAEENYARKRLHYNQQSDI